MDAKKHGTNETLNFSDLNGCSGSIPDGYGGFNWIGSFEYINTMCFNTAWCDTGYNNVAAVSASPTVAWVYDYGTVESAKLSESFDLKSIASASAWDTNQEWTFTSYTYKNGSFTVKGSANVYLSQLAQTINFATLGGKGAFQKIDAIHIQVDNLGTSGNTCSYGASTYGYQMVFDNVKVHWNGKIPQNNGAHLVQLPGHMPHPHHHATLAALHNSGGHAPGTWHGGHTAPHHAGGAYHSQLLNLGHDPGGLTTEFRLPQPGHFGI
jgi:hypothetical protein